MQVSVAFFLPAGEVGVGRSCSGLFLCVKDFISVFLFLKKKKVVRNLPFLYPSCRL